MATTHSTNGSLTISQEYFDELCLENRDDFELSEEDAVHETIQQLASSHGNKTLPSHLTLTFPTSEQGVQERNVNRQLHSGIARIQQAVVDNKNAETSSSQDEAGRERLSATLQSLLECLRQEETRRVPRFVVFGGFEACIQLWGSMDMQGWDEHVYELLLRTFHVAALGGAETGLRTEDLQVHFLRLWPTWLSTLESAVLSTAANSANPVETWNLGLVHQILQLASHAVKHSEPNKKVFMAAKSNNTNKSAPSILLGTLDALSLMQRDSPDHHRLVGGPLCRLVAALCTFDDFRAQGGAAPTVSSAHANVQSFHQENGVVRIARYLQENKESSAILALRAMAIHDEIVQAMVAVGVLGTSTDLLQKILSEDTADRDSKTDEATTVEALTAVAGLFRNVCANDEIKSKLCVGDKSIVRHLVCVMEAYPDTFKLQEHACATFGAMALRSPRNAEFLVLQNDAATWIIRAMQKHPQRTTVQRQGALALRNLVSRSTDLRTHVLQAGAAETLKDVAARHVSCQDEVYAALRDMGLPASMLRVEQDASGQVLLKQTEMFGERKSNFRPVFD